MDVLIIIFLILLFSVILGAGLFLFLRPTLTIEIQKKFYEKINWRVEPISMDKEIRNTRVMGLFLAIATVLAALSIIIRSIFMKGAL